MRRIDRHRRQQRIQFLFAIVVDEAQRLRIQLVQAEHANSILAQRRTQARIPAVVLIVHEFVRQFAQQVALGRQRHAVGTGLVVAVFDLLHHGGHAHFEELVQIAG